jgi:hypothetical protein
MIPRDAERGFIAEGDNFKSQKRNFEVERSALTRGVQQTREVTLNYVRIKDNRRR